MGSAASKSVVVLGLLESFVHTVSLGSSLPTMTCVTFDGPSKLHNSTPILFPARVSVDKVCMHID